MARSRGVATGDLGIGKDGQPGHNFQPGMEAACPPDHLRRRLPRFADQGTVGQFNLRDGIDPQTYGIGIKELWGKSTRPSTSPA